jgi:hypothetical protein
MITTSVERLEAISAAIRSGALELEFDQVGIAPVRPREHADFYRRWVEAGRAGEMEDDEPLIPGHAAWALGRIGTAEGLNVQATPVERHQGRLTGGDRRREPRAR